MEKEITWVIPLPKSIVDLVREGLDPNTNVEQQTAVALEISDDLLQELTWDSHFDVEVVLSRFMVGSEGDPAVCTRGIRTSFFGGRCVCDDEPNVFSCAFQKILARVLLSLTGEEDAVPEGFLRDARFDPSLALGSARDDSLLVIRVRMVLSNSEACKVVDLVDRVDAFNAEVADREVQGVERALPLQRALLVGFRPNLMERLVVNEANWLCGQHVQGQ
jgi:hypothetical protein